MLQTLIKPILAILILFIPLYPKFPLQTIKGTYVAIRLDDIVVALSLLIWIIYQIKNRLPILKTKINRLFFLYFLAICLSTTHALFIFQTEPRHLLLLHLLRRFEYMSLFFITITAIKKRSHLSFTYFSMLTTTFLVCLYGYGQKYFKLPIISTMNAEFAKGQLLQMENWARISSTFAGHYDLATYLSVTLIIIAGIIITTKKITTKIISIIFWLIAFHILTLTASRVSIMALWGASIVTFILLKKYLWILPVSALIVFSMITSGDLNQRLLATLPAVNININLKRRTPTPTPTATPTPLPPPTSPVKPVPVKIKVIATPTPTPTIIRHQPEQPPIDADAGVARSGEIRFKAEWPRAINAYKKNPLSGTGLGSITLATDNDYLRLLGESGTLGFISLTAIIIWFFIKTIPSIKKKKQTPVDTLNIILFGATLSFLANAIFIDVFEASKTAYMFWIMMGIYHQNILFQKRQ